MAAKSIIILNNTGISYSLKQQLTLDIADVLYGKEPSNRENDTTLSLIKSVVSGDFDQTLNTLNSEKNNLDFHEQSLSPLAFELLWSNIISDSLKLFAFISNTFPESKQAELNLQRACKHRLAKNVKIREIICN